MDELSKAFEDAKKSVEESSAPIKDTGVKDKSPPSKTVEAEPEPTPPPGDKGEETTDDEEYKDTPFHTHPRFKALIKAKNELKSEVERWSELGADPETIRRSIEVFNTLVADPSFQKWAELRIAEEEKGSEEEFVDPDKEIKALKAEIKSLKESFGGLSSKHVDEDIDKHFATMDTRFEGWQDYKPSMLKTLERWQSSGMINPKAADNPSFEVIRDIYFVTVGEKLPEIGKELYEKSLIAAKKKASEKARTPGSEVESRKTINTIEDALKLAREEIAAKGA